MGVVLHCRRSVFMVACATFLGAPLEAGEVDRGDADVLALTAENWPCKADYRTDIAEASPWPRPALLKESADWRDSADIEALVEAAVTSSRIEHGAQALERFASEIQASELERDRLLTTVFIGLRDEMSLYRDMVAFGIMQGVVKAELATRIAKDAKTKEAKGQHTFEEALRIEDDAMDEARFLCGRMDALDTKFQTLAEVLRQHLTPSSG